MGSSGIRRADARHNRERIVAAAAEVFARDGAAPLSAIGKAAGVGQGTLYRHFPDREALVWAVYEREVDELVAGAGELLASLPPRQALHDWMVHLARFALTKASLGAGMNQRIDGHTQAARPGYVRIATATENLLQASRNAGVVRDDVTIKDFLDLVAGLWQIGPGPDAEDRARRLIGLVMLAITTPFTSPPEAAVTPAD